MSAPESTSLRRRLVKHLERVTRPAHFHTLRHAAYCVRNARSIGSVLGARNGLRFAWLPVWYEIRRSLGGRAPATYELRSPAALHPLRLRFDTSDLAVFVQIFVEQEFAPLDDLTHLESIIDCGANVGFASAWFLSRNPRARIVVVEPDPDNFQQLRANLAPYGARVEFHQNAVWKHAARLKLVRSADYRHQWAVEVRECGDSEPCDMVALDVPALTTTFGDGPIDLLKVDIEGAEVEVFGDPAAPWISRLRVCTVECHGLEADAVVARAFPPDQFDRTFSGELTMFRRRHAGVAAADGGVEARPPSEWKPGVQGALG